MHELSICAALLRQVESVASLHDATAVESIEVGLGPLCGVDAGLLRQAFTVARAGTIAENAELELTVTELRVRCEACGHEGVVRPNRLLCADCGTWKTRVVSGDEMFLRRIELEIQDAQQAAREATHV